jgi:hypothetical protein
MAVHIHDQDLRPPRRNPLVGVLRSGGAAASLAYPSPGGYLKPRASIPLPAAARNTFPWRKKLYAAVARDSVIGCGSRDPPGETMTAQVYQIRDFQSKKDLERMRQALEKEAAEIMSQIPDGMKFEAPDTDSA